MAFVVWQKTANSNVSVVAAVVHSPAAVLAKSESLFTAKTMYLVQPDLT